MGSVSDAKEHRRAHVSPFPTCWALRGGPLNLGLCEGDSSSAVGIQLWWPHRLYLLLYTADTVLSWLAGELNACIEIFVPLGYFASSTVLGYWYPPDYPYQQALYNSQMQHYYPQLYGPTSPSTSPYPYMGYMPGGLGPRAGFSPMQQASRPPFFQHPTTQIEGSFQTAPSLPPNFRLQLPPRAISRQSDVSGSQPTQTISETAATATDNQEASMPIKRSNSDLSTSN